MKVIAYIQVKIVMEIPDATDREDAIEAATEIIDDCDYSFKAADHHIADGLKITDTEITEYNDEDWKVNP
jgi:hypothetical protein